MSRKIITIGECSLEEGGQCQSLGEEISSWLDEGYEVLVKKGKVKNEYDFEVNDE